MTVKEKRFLCISGPMGVGKTTVCRAQDSGRCGKRPLPRYGALNTEKLDVSELSPEEAAEAVCRMI